MLQFDPGFYKVNDILDIFGIEKATLDDWLAKNEFPSPDLCIGNAGFWNKSTVNEFLAKKAGKEEEPKIELNINVNPGPPEAEADFFLSTFGAKKYPVYRYYDLEHKLGLCRTAIRLRVRRGVFPPPLALGVYCRYNKWSIWDKNIVDNFFATGTFPPEANEYYTTADVAYMLRITPAGLRYRLERGKYPIPYVAFTGNVSEPSNFFFFWDKNVIDAFMLATRRGVCPVLD